LIFSEGAGLLRQAFLDLFPIGVLNMHGAGPLPLYRGIGALEFALIERHPVTMNLHLIDEGIDTGPLLAAGVVRTGRTCRKSMRVCCATAATSSPRPRDGCWTGR